MIITAFQSTTTEIKQSRMDAAQLGEKQMNTQEYRLNLIAKARNKKVSGKSAKQDFKARFAAYRLLVQHGLAPSSDIRQAMESYPEIWKMLEVKEDSSPAKQRRIEKAFEGFF